MQKNKTLQLSCTGVIVLFLFCAIFLANTVFAADVTGTYSYASLCSYSYTATSGQTGSATVSGDTFTLKAQGTNETTGCNSTPAVECTTTLTITPNQNVKITATAGTGATVTASGVTLGVETQVVSGTKITFSITASNGTEVSNTLKIVITADETNNVPSGCASYYVLGGDQTYFYLDEAIEATKKSDGTYSGTVVVGTSGTMYHSDHANGTTTITIPAGVTLLLPRMPGKTDIAGDSDKFPNANYALWNKDSRWEMNTSAGNKYQYLLLTIPKGTTVNNNGRIILGGSIAAQIAYFNGVTLTHDYWDGSKNVEETEHDHSDIKLEGTLNMGDNSVLSSVGFITGGGTINANGVGAKIYQPFVVNDYKGGTYTVMATGKAQAADYHVGTKTDEDLISPFIRYTMQNIQTTINMNAGNYMYGYMDLWASDLHNQTTAVIIGDSEQEGLLNLHAGATLTAKYTNSNKVQHLDAYKNGNSSDGTYNKNGWGYNQIGRTNLTIDGGAYMGDLSMTITVGSYSEHVSLSRVTFPIPYNFNITLKNGEYTITNSTMLLPGATLTVESDAKLLIGNGADDMRFMVMDGLYDLTLSATTSTSEANKSYKGYYPDYTYPKTGELQTAGLSGTAQLIINGELVVNQGVSFGGLVQTKTNGAKVTFNGTNSCDVQIGLVGSKKIVQTNYTAGATVRVLNALLKGANGDIIMESGKSYVGSIKTGNTISSYSYQLYPQYSTTTPENHTDAANVACTCGGTKGGTNNCVCNIFAPIEIYGQWADCSHENTTDVVTAPTCTEKGYTTHTCTECGNSYIDTYVDALGHTEVIDHGQDATCTETGLTEGKHCSVCNATIVAQTTVNALGHNKVVDAAYVAPTCTAAGSTEASHCSRCDAATITSEVIPATGHTEVIDKAVAATCTTTGLTEGKHCSVCNEVFVAQETVAALGHKYNAVVTAPTCTKNGYTLHTCTVCSATLFSDYTKALGHKFVDGFCTVCETEKPAVSATIGLKYDDRLEGNIEIIDFGTPTSYKVGYGVAEGTKDTAVVTLEGNTLIATGIGTATVSIDGVIYDINVKPAPISMLLLIGQSNMAGSVDHATADQSVANKNGWVYSTYRTTTTSTAAGTYAPSALAGEYSLMNIDGGAITGIPLNSLTEAGDGKVGVDGALAYEWTTQTGEKVWIINAARGSTQMKSWAKGASQYNYAVEIFKACQETMKKEIEAGHYTLSHMGYFWCQGCSDTTMSASEYVDKYLGMHEGLKADLAFDHDSNPETADRVMEFGSTILVRAGAKSDVGYRDGDRVSTDVPYWASFQDLRMTGPRVAQIWMGNNPELKDIWNVCMIGENWVTMPDGTDGVADYFASRYQDGRVNYPTQLPQDEAWYKPTTPLDVHPTVHYTQIGYNELGLEAARNTLYNLGVLTPPENEMVEVKFVGWDGYTEIGSVAADASASDRLVVPMVSPVYMSKSVTYNVVNGVNYTYYDITGNNGLGQGGITAVGAQGSVTVEPAEITSETLKGHVQYPGDVCSGTNLWEVLTPEQGYFTAKGAWTTSQLSGHTIWSVTFPVTPGERFYASSLQKSPDNGYTGTAYKWGAMISFHTASGKTVRWSVDSNGQLFAEKYGGYIHVKDDLIDGEPVAYMTVTMWSENPEGGTWEIYMLDRGHSLTHVDAKAPTCTEAGHKAYEYCSVCNYTTFEEVAATGHSYQGTVTAPTCDQEGYTTYVCSCGDSYTADIVAALGHEYESVVTTDATCTTTGVKTFTCSRCNDSYTEAIDALGHTAGKVVIENNVAPTYNATGSYDNVVYCSVCGAELSREAVTVPMLQGAQASVNGVKYGTLAEALAQGGNVKLLADIETDAAFVINNTVVLDLNGFNVKTTVNDTAGDGVFHVIAGGDLTINGEGEINGVGGNYYCIAIWADGGKVTINGGTYTNVGAGDDDHYDLIYVKNGGEVIINGGIFKAHTPAWTLNSHDTNKGTITVNGGEFHGFNPYNNNAEGKNTNFVAEGKHAAADENGVYTIHDCTTETKKENEVGATCTTNGSYDNVTYCTECGEELSRETITVDSLGHSYESVVTAPNFDEKGYTTHTCTRCGDQYVDSYVDALIAVAEANGVKYQTLAEALAQGGNVKLLADIETDAAFVINNTVVLDLNGFNVKTTVNDTAGDGVFHVIAGGDLTINGEGEINGVGGNYYCIAIWADGGKVTINGGTYTNVGAGDDDHYDLIYVKNGGEVIINGGIFKAHTPAWTLNSHDTNKGTITVNGGEFHGFNPYNNNAEGKNTNFVAEGKHAAADENGVYTIHDCTTETKKENEVGATCTTNGSYDNVTYCTKCGEELSRETVTVDSLGHKYEAVVTAPTCTDKGYTTYTCHCGDSYVADEVAALGHSWNNGEITTAPSCETEGVKTYTCGTCGETKTEVVEATGHTEVEIPAVDATCTEPGSTAGVKCSVCDTVITAPTVVESKGHKYVAVVTAPTCTAQGYTTYTCSVCGDSYVDTYVDATGHVNTTTTTVDATCTTDGSITIKCECGHVVSTEVISAKGHSMGTGYEHDDNGHWHVCTVCGTASAANGHVYDRGYCDCGVFIVQYANVNLNLDSEIILQLKFWIPEAIRYDDSIVMRIVKNSGKGDPLVMEYTMADIRSMTPDSKQRYRFDIPLASPELSRDVTVQFIRNGVELLNILDKNGAITDASVHTALDYARLALEEGSADTKNLIKALLVYGGYAQQYFGVDADEPVYNLLPEYGYEIPSLDHITVDSLGVTQSASGYATGIAYRSDQAVLDSSIGHQVNFNLLDGHTMDEYTFVVTKIDGKGKEYTETVEPVAHKTDKTRCYVVITDIASPNLDYMYTITVTHNVTGEVYEVKDSVMNWVKAALVLEPTAKNLRTINMAKAIYYYNYYANIVFDR